MDTNFNNGTICEFLMTIGDGRKRPQGKNNQFSVSPNIAVSDLVKTLNSLKPLKDGWFTLSLYNGSYRNSANWVGSSGIILDYDFETKSYINNEGKTKRDHVAPSPEFIEKLATLVEKRKLPGSLHYQTPRGFRNILLLEAPTAAHDHFLKLVVGAENLVEAALVDEGILWSPENGGYRADKTSNYDLARFFFLPNAIVDGVNRTSNVVVLRSELYRTDELLSDVSASLTQRLSKQPQSRWEEGDVKNAIKSYNDAHPLDLPKNGGICPICKHRDCFGQLSGNPRRWYCFSANHPDGAGVKGEKGFHGDALDIAVHQLGLDRIDVLRRAGYIDDSNDRAMRSSSVGGVPDDKLIAAAKDKVAEIVQDLKCHPGRVFAEDVLEALLILKDYDQPNWQNFLADARKSFISKREINKLVEDYRAKTLPKTTERHIATRTIDRIIDEVPAGTEALVMPFCYGIEDGHVVHYRYKSGGLNVRNFELVSDTPVFVIARYVDINDQSISLTLVWRRKGCWHSLSAPREIVFDSRKLISLAARDFPVSSNNVGSLVKYLADFEATNIGRIHEKKTTSRLGWLGGNGNDGFLIGRTLIDGSGRIFRRDDAELIGSSSETIFHVPDFGSMQLADGFRQGGKYAEWLDVVFPLAGYPTVLIVFYSAFVPPLLQILNAPNFVLDLAGRTSLGKTTALRVAASIWGNPDETSRESIITTWDSTKVANERIAAILNGLPFFKDDTKTAPSSGTWGGKAVAETVYAVTNGRGRDRGTPQGLATTSSWCTVLISTGESPITAFSEDGGSRARVLSLCRPPFGGESKEIAAFVQRLNTGVRANFGYAGLIFMQRLLQNRHRWGEFRDRYVKYMNELSQDHPSAVAGRLASYVATIMVAGELAHEFLELSFVYRNPFADLWREIAEMASEAPPVIRALRMLLSFCTANAERFQGREPIDKEGYSRIPSNGWFGIWELRTDWDRIVFFPDQLRDILKKLDFSEQAFLPALRENGWLELDGDKKGRFTKSVRVAGNTQKMVCIRRTAFVEVGALIDEKPENSVAPTIDDVKASVKQF